MADGKFYTEKVLPDLPYQRAIISYHNGEELLILQAKFEGEGKDFGWVIPVPNPPKLGSIKSEEIEHFFLELALSTNPIITDGRMFIFSGSFLSYSLCLFF